MGKAACIAEFALSFCVIFPFFKNTIREKRKAKAMGWSKKTVFYAAAFVLVLIGAIAAVRCISGHINRMMYPKEYQDAVETYAEQYGVDEDLVYAVIHTESGFQEDAVSSVGARGCMQLMQETYDWAKMRMGDDREITYDDMFDPELNIQYGTFVLSLLLEEFGQQDTALAAYHAGWSKVKEWLDNPEVSHDGVKLHAIPFADTSSYVKKVNEALNIYRKIY